MEKKLQELRLKHSSMKNELNKAHRVISKEIGDDFDVDQVSGWCLIDRLWEQIRGKAGPRKSKSWNRSWENSDSSWGLMLEWTWVRWVESQDLVKIWNQLGEIKKLECKVIPREEHFNFRPQKWLLLKRDEEKLKN